MKIIDQNNFYLKKLMPLVLMFGTGGYMLSISWWKWPDIQVDFGGQLYKPWRLNNGIVLRQDIDHIFGPLSPYLNSLLFKAFGTSIMTLAVFNIVLIVVLSCLMYRIFIETTDTIAATFAVTVFLGIFAFSQYVGIGNYNFVTPYSHNLTHGIVLSFFSMYTFLRYIKKPKTIWLGIVGLSIGFVFLCKVEVFLAISLSTITGILLFSVIDRPQLSTVIKQFGVLILGFLIPIVFFVLFLSHYMPIDNAVLSILTEYKILSTPASSNPFYNPFYSKVTGRDQPILNLIILFKTAGWYVLIFSVFGIAAFALNSFSATSKRTLSGLTKIGIAVISIPFLIIQTDWFNIARALPLAMLIVCIYYFVSLIRHREDKQKVIKLLPLFVLAAFSGLLLLKMILNVHVYHYGFALAMPATLLIVLVLLYHVPQFIGKNFGNTDYVQVLGILLTCTIIVLHINVTKRIYAQKTFPVGTGGDIILTRSPNISPKGAVIRLALEKISEIVKPDETLIVFPRGITINYLARRVNPTRFISFLPPYLTHGWDKMCDSIKEGSPNYIVLIEWDSTEHGARYFGKDYAVKLYSWIMENYTQVEKIGSQPFTGKGFGIIIMKRNETYAPPDN